MKTTKNNSMMAYIQLEDDTGTIELLVFSNTLTQYGAFLKENTAVVVVGRLSARDEKDPQIVPNRVRLLKDVAENKVKRQSAEQPFSVNKLYLKLPSEDSVEYCKCRAILNMFPGKVPTVLYFEDTKIRRGAFCDPQSIMIAELQSLLGEANVVLK